jgi:CHAT domain-containing protein
MASKRLGFWHRVTAFVGYALLGMSLVLLVQFHPTLTEKAVGKPHNPIANDKGLMTNDHIATADAARLEQQGRELYATGQFAEAAMAWQEAAHAYQTQGEALNQAAVLSHLSLAYQELGQLDEAEVAIANSLQLLDTPQLQPTERLPILAKALNTQGSLQLAQGQAERALATWQQAAATYEQIEDEVGWLGSSINQAQAQQVLGLYLRARQTLARVEQALNRQSDPALQVTGLLNLGNVLQSVGEFERARAVLQQSLAIAQQADLSQTLHPILLSLGNAARGRGDVEAALGFYQQAAAASTSPTAKTQSQLNQLSLLVAREQFSAANALLPDIQAEIANLPASRTAVYARINFAQTLATLKQRQASEAPTWQEIAQITGVAAQQAKRLGDPKARAYALGSLGKIYETNEQWLEAQDLTEQALILAQANNAPEIAYRWQWQLGRLLRVRGETEKAIATYAEAVNTLSSLRNDLVAVSSDVQFSFRESVEPVYREFVSLLLAADAGQPSSPERIERARQTIESLQLAELDNFFRSACLRANYVPIDTIDRDAAVIYPIILRDRIEVILSLPQQPLRHYPTFLAQDEVEAILGRLRRTLTQRGNRTFLPLSQQVYDWLIRPIEADLQESPVKTLVFVLDGFLRNIPMAALHDGEEYLIEKYSLALAPGLELIDPRPLPERRLAVLKAGLSQARQGYPSLPYVEVELQRIQALVSGETLLNEEFTNAAVRQELQETPFPVIHLATHGQFSSNIEDTFILTWNDRIDIAELTNLLETTDPIQSRPIELLVLSACETARGDERATLGLAGVAVRAGARSTLATSWLVDDETTAALMSQFYEQLADANLTKAEALRRAQLLILQDSQSEQHPYYWAPYLLVGNWL